MPFMYTFSVILFLLGNAKARGKMKKVWKWIEEHYGVFFLTTTVLLVGILILLWNDREFAALLGLALYTLATLMSLYFALKHLLPIRMKTKLTKICITLANKVAPSGQGE